MPIYEYRCGVCGFQKEFLQRISDAAPTDCPECGKPSLNKMVTAAGFQLKGSGWYATDFKTSGSAKPNKADVSKSTDAPKKDDSKSTDAPKKDDAKSTDVPKKDNSKAAAASGTGAGSTCQ